MKKVLLILLALFCFGNNLLEADNENNKPSQKPIIIKNLKNIVGIERSGAQSVVVELSPMNNAIEFEIQNIGDGEIYILDSTSSVIASQVIFSEITNYSIDAPYSSGCYTIVVISDCFYGECFFEI